LKVKFATTRGPGFYDTLRKRVDSYFKENNISTYANRPMVVKTVSMLSMYVIPYLVIMLVQPPLYVMFLLTVLMGIGMAGIGASVMHDANHGSYSRNQTTNKLLGYTLNLLGGNVFTWKMQHNVNHHSFTNIYHADEDIEGTFFLRFSPNAPLRKIHKAQHIYSWFFYGFMTIAWVFWKDYIKFAKHINDGTNRNSRKKNLAEFAELIAFKLVYMFYIGFLPLFFLDITFAQFAIGFFTIHFTAGFILSIIFQLAHLVEGTSHPEPDEKGNIEEEWAVHQLYNTCNFATRNRLITWFAGGLNFQVEHHLFPRICHIHYSALSEIVKKTAQDFGIPYLENKSFTGALVSHGRMIKKLGRE
jgi:linoleoyl-CoA desaturase